MITTDPELVPQEQKPIFLESNSGPYSPHWLRGRGEKREGWCGICKPGQWFPMKNQAFENHKTFIHGVVRTRRVLPKLNELRRTNKDPDLWEAHCANCNQWVILVRGKNRVSPSLGMPTRYPNNEARFHKIALAVP
jgi:hypothetical protein